MGKRCKQRCRAEGHLSTSTTLEGAERDGLVRLKQKKTLCLPSCFVLFLCVVVVRFCLFVDLMFLFYLFCFSCFIGFILILCIVGDMLSLFFFGFCVFGCLFILFNCLLVFNAFCFCLYCL